MIRVPQWLLWALAFLVGLPVIGFAVIMCDHWWLIRKNRKEQSK